MRDLSAALGGSKVRLLLFVFALGLPVAAWHAFPVAQWATRLSERAVDLGTLGIAAFALGYVVVACLGFPRTLLNLAAGMVFSLPAAMGVVFIASTATYCCTFTIARHLARDWVKRKIHDVPNGTTLLKAAEREGFKLVLLTRMNPLIPAVLNGYGFGTTGMSLGSYLLASMLGSLPIVAAQVYLGWVGGAAMVTGDQRMGNLQLAIVAIGAVASALLAAGIAVFAHRAIRSRTAETDGC